MSRTLNTRLADLATRQSSKPSVHINRSLDIAHARLSSVSRRTKRYKRLQDVSDASLRSLAASFGLDTWSDEPSNGVQVLSITGKIIVVDIGLEVGTNAVKSCTLVLASEDGLQDEIFSDGRDTLFSHLVNGRLDSFSRDLETLAFLDRHSDPAIGLSLFQVQDGIRDALNKKLKDKDGFTSVPIVGSSHLNVSLLYHTTHRELIKEADSKAHSVIPYKRYTARLEIEEQSVSSSSGTNGATAGPGADDFIRRPDLRYPQSWVDASGTWLPTRQLIYARSKADLRYVLALEPSVLVPQSMADHLARSHPSRIETDPAPGVSRHQRKVVSPSSERDFRVTCAYEESMVTIRRVAFAHPKEVEQILSVARQFASCQHLISTLGNPDTAIGDCPSAFTVKAEMVTDNASSIDQRKSIKISIVPGLQDCKIGPMATILILPDSTYKCWHRSGNPQFTTALSTTEDVLLSLVWLDQQPNSSSPTFTADTIIPDASQSSEDCKVMDFRVDPNDATVRGLSAIESKQGYAYTIPVDTKVETKSTSFADPGSPGYLAALGSFLRAQDSTTPTLP